LLLSPEEPLNEMAQPGRGGIRCAAHDLSRSQRHRAMFLSTLDSRRSTSQR